MANWVKRKTDLSYINGGQRFVDGDMLDAESINAAIEGSAYAQDIALQAEADSKGAKLDAETAKTDAATARTKAEQADSWATYAYEKATRAEKTASETNQSVENISKRLTNVENGLPSLPIVVKDGIGTQRVPSNSLPYASIREFGGLTYVSENIFNSSPFVGDYDLGGGMLSIGVASFSLSNAASASTSQTFKQFCPDAVIGKTYGITYKASEASDLPESFGTIYINNGKIYAPSGYTFTMTADILNSPIAISGGYDVSVYNICVTEDAPKEYTKYLEPTYNLFNVRALAEYAKGRGIAVDGELGKISANQSCEGLTLKEFCRGIEFGKTYTLSYRRLAYDNLNIAIRGSQTQPVTSNVDGYLSVCFTVISEDVSLDILVENALIPNGAFSADRFTLVEGTNAKPFIAYGRWRDNAIAKIVSLNSLQSSTIDTVLFDDAILARPAYGKGVSGAPKKTNNVVFEDGKVEYRQYVGENNNLLQTPIVSDISAIVNPYGYMLKVVPNGYVAAYDKNGNLVSAPMKVAYQTEAR